jgi:hypothetical protein
VQPLIAVGSFAVYTQCLGGELTAPKAFTCLAIFSMINGPLNILPRIFQVG